MSSMVKKTLPILLEAKEATDAIFLLVPSMINVNANQRRVMELFSGTPARCMNSVFPARAVFGDCTDDGMTLTEIAEKGNRREREQAEKAISEIGNIASELDCYLKKSKRTPR